MKNVVFFDLDKTIIRGYTQKIFLKYLYKKGNISLFFVIKVYLWFFLYKLKIVKNPKKIMETSFLFIKGLEVFQLKAILDDFFEKELDSRFNEVIVNRIREHLHGKDDVYIITNSPEPIAKIIGERLGVFNVIATKLKVKDCKYTGEINGEIIYGNEKVIKANEILKSENHYSKSFFYTDHYSDLPLLEKVDKKIVVSPDKILTKKAKENSWEIIRI